LHKNFAATQDTAAAKIAPPAPIKAIYHISSLTFYLKKSEKAVEFATLEY
jgi:hypothetical protein